MKMFGTFSDADVLKIIRGERSYDDFPIEDEGNEIAKGFFFDDQADFVMRHGGEELRCSVLGEPCLRESCPLYNEIKQRPGVPVCTEYKLAFETGSNSDLIDYIEKKWGEALARASKQIDVERV